MQSEPLSRARANARQTLELFDQPRQRSGESAQGSAADGPDSRQNVAIEAGSDAADPILSRLLICGMLVLVLGACAAGPTAGLQSYQSPDGRFAFLYPTGWTQVQVSNGPRVVFHDLIHSDETVSLMINKVNEDNELSELGSAVAAESGCAGK